MLRLAEGHVKAYANILQIIREVVASPILSSELNCPTIPGASTIMLIAAKSFSLQINILKF